MKKLVISLLVFLPIIIMANEKQKIKGQELIQTINNSESELTFKNLHLIDKVDFTQIAEKNLGQQVFQPQL